MSALRQPLTVALHLLNWFGFKHFKVKVDTKLPPEWQLVVMYAKNDQYTTGKALNDFYNQRVIPMLRNPNFTKYRGTTLHTEVEKEAIRTMETFHRVEKRGGSPDKNVVKSAKVVVSDFFKANPLPRKI